MRAVWRAARAAVRRRRMQTVVIAIVVLFSTATISVALGLLAASTQPFERAFAQQHGAHVTATFHSTVDEKLPATSDLDGVTDAAGPFGLTTESLKATDAPDYVPGVPFTVVGRDRPRGGAVDSVDLWAGRWATKPGELVVNVTPGMDQPARDIGTSLTDAHGRTFTVVGKAYSLSDTADAWVTPKQMTDMKPTETQMLYRFADHDTSDEIAAGLKSVTDRLPAHALVASQSYLVVKKTVSAGPGKYLPFLMVFGILGVLVAVFVVVNVVSGAVVSGFRHIGVLKSLGFTPRQVAAVYLVMVSVPAVAGAAIGATVGAFAQQPVLSESFRGSGLGTVSASPWVIVVAAAGMPALVLLAAFLPAMRAHRLSAAAAISAGSAPRHGRGVRVQRWLAGRRLPRAVSLGLGLPFARPGRTAMTLAAIVLGVTTVAFTTGMASTVIKYANALGRVDYVQAVVGSEAGPGGPQSSRSDVDTEKLLRDVPGTAHVTADLVASVSLVGYSHDAEVDFLRGDTTTLGYGQQLVAGRWFDAAGEGVVTSKFLHQRGVHVGDRVTVELNGSRTTITIVGQVMGGNNAAILTDWGTYERLDVTKRPGPIQYQVGLEPGTSLNEYRAAVHDAAADLRVEPNEDAEVADAVAALIALITALALMLSTVAALGVFHTVVLNVAERRRDLGTLKSVGMTPRQVVSMVVTSMAALGVVGGAVGLGLGVLAYRLTMPLASAKAQIDFPDSLTRIWDAPTLVLLALTGIVVAVCGAFLPARRAARLRIAEVLHNE